MSIRAECPACGASYKLRDELAGKRVRCKECGDTFAVGGRARRAADEDAAPGRASSGAPVALIIAGCVVGVLVLVGGTVGFFVWRSKGCVKASLARWPRSMAAAGNRTTKISTAP